MRLKGEYKEIMSVGRIVQIQGPVVDAQFAAGELPNILNALTIADAERSLDLTVEVAQHLGNDVVRCVGRTLCTRSSASSRVGGTGTER